MKSARSEISFKPMGQELLPYKVLSLSLFFFPSTDMDLRQRFRECLLDICKEVAFFGIILYFHRKG